MKKRLRKQIIAAIMACSLIICTIGTNTAFAADKTENTIINNFSEKIFSETEKKSKIVEDVKLEERAPEFNRILRECKEVKTDERFSGIKRGQMVSVANVPKSNAIYRMAIMTNGDLYCWGYNDCGQVGNGTTENQTLPIKILSDIVFASCSNDTVLAIMANGDLYCWGDNDCGQVGNGTMENQTLPQKVLSNVSFVSCEDNCVVAITINKDLYYWGYTPLGEGEFLWKRQTIPVKILSDVASASLFYDSFVAAITTNGDLYCWGDNSHGQVGNGTTKTQQTPIKVLDNVTYVSFSDNVDNRRGYYGSSRYISGLMTAVTKSGDLYCWGDNNYGQVGNGTFENQAKPVKILSNVAYVSASIAGLVAAITTNGDLYCWGKNKSGQVGDGTFENQAKPVKILNDVTSVYISTFISCEYSDVCDGDIFVSDFVAAITTNRDLYCWGNNIDGQVGNGTMFGQNIPIKVLNNVKSVSIQGSEYYPSSAVSLGYGFVVAVTTNGDLYCWGRNHSLKPKKLLNNVEYVTINSHGTNFAAITENKDLYYWNGLKLTKILNNISYVALISGFNMAITENGELYCWGQNNYGQVGNDTTEDQSIPVKILPQDSSDGIASFTLAETANATLKDNDNSFTFSGHIYLEDGKTASSEEWQNIVNSINWTSSDPSVVTDIKCQSVIDGNEQGDIEITVSVFLKSTGTAMVTGTIANGLSSSCDVTVGDEDKIAKLTLDKTSSAKLKDNNFTFSGHVYLKDGETADNEEWQKIIDNIKWTSSDPSVVTDIKCQHVVDGIILVSASLKSVGKAKVTGTTVGGLLSSCDIIVENEDIKKHIVSLSPKQDYCYEDLSDIKCIIKFDAKIKDIKDGVVSLVEYNTDRVIEEINLKKSIENGDGKVESAATDTDTIIFRFNYQSALEEKTLLFPNTKYYILIEDSIIELNNGDLLTGIDEKNYWSFTTISIEHPLIRNSKADDEKIELSKYMTFFKPLTALYIREHDDGTNGLCFGISYATGAWNSGYSGVHSIGKSANSLMDMKLSTKGDLQYTFWEYLQLAQIAQYTSEIDSILKKNEVNEKKLDKMQDFYNAVKNFQNNNGNMVIFGAYDHEGNGHAIIPVGISYEDSNSVIIKTYNCNGNGDIKYNNKFVYDLTLIKENGKFIDWDFEDFNNKDGKKGYFRFFTVDEVIDMAIRIANSEKKESSNLIFSDSELGNLEEIDSCTNTVTDKPVKHLYWINDTSVIRQVSDNDNLSEIGITDGEREISAVMPLNTKVKLDLSSEFINANLSKTSDYSLSFVSSDVDDNILSLVINGKTKGEILAEHTKDGIILKADNLLDTVIVIKNNDKSNNLVFSSGKKDVLINTTDKKVSVSEDSNGDGKYDNEIASIDIINNYTVNYILNGGNVSGNPTSYIADMLPITLKNPTRNGYTFIGWTGSNGSIPQILVTITKGTTGKLNYTANWEKITSLPSPSPSPSNNGMGNNTGSGGGGVSGNGGTSSGTGSTGGGGAIITPTSTPVATLIPSPSPTPVTTAITEPSQATTPTQTPKPSTSAAPTATPDSTLNDNIKKEIAYADVTLNKKSVIYNGKKKKPRVTVLNDAVELTQNTDYTVSYYNNTKVGTATVTITGIGNYSGSVSKAFKIIPKGTPVKGKVKPKHKGFTVKWKKQPKSITGYQVQYSTSKKFKGKTTVIRTVKKKSITKLTAGRLKTKKKHYVRVRTYKTVKGKKYYSKWSTAKTVTTKI